MTDTLAVQEKNLPDDPRNFAVSMLPVAQMQPVLAEYVTRRKAFRDWLLGQLVKGVHYGVPPGCEPKTNNQGLPIDHRGFVIPEDQWRFKPTLYKAGADFLCDLLKMDPRFSPDLDTWKMLGSREGTVVIKCELVSRSDNPFFQRHAGEILGEGRGAGVAGEKKRDGNGAIKIGQKSAKIDAVINALGLSDLFTQDVDPPAPNPAPDADPNAPKVAPRAERQSGPPTVKEELYALFGRWKKKAGRGTIADFSVWAQKLFKNEKDYTHVDAWTIDLISAADAEI